MSLNDKNYKSVIKDIKTKGFTAKFWQDHRSVVAKGCGVAKAMNQLKSLGVPPSGEFKSVDIDSIHLVIKAFEDLDKAMLKAQGRAVKAAPLGKHTYELCRGYGEVINARLFEARAYKKTSDKKLAEVKQKNNDDTKKELEKFNKQRDKDREVIFKEMAELDKRARGILKACTAMFTDVSLAAKDVSKLHEGLKSQMGPGGQVDPKIAERFEKGLVALQKKYNLPLHGNNIRKALPKIFKETSGQYSKYMKLDFGKEERISLGASIREAHDALKKATAAFDTYAERHKAFAQDIKSAQAQGA